MEFLHTISLEREKNIVGIWNSLWMRLAFVDKSEINFDDLFNNKIVFSQTENLKKINEIRCVIDNLPISVAYLILSQSCNLRCKYCYLGHAIGKNLIMSNDVIIQSIDYAKNIFKQNHIDSPDIILYGGEPLINRHGLFCSIKHIRRVIPDAVIVVNTNGTLVDDELSKLFSSYNVKVCVSLDGFKKENDSCRVDKYGFGTFEKVVNSIRKLKRYNNTVNISCTITRSNYLYIKSFSRFLVRDVGVDNVDFNLLLGEFSSREEMIDYAKLASEAIVDTYNDLKKHDGIIIDRVERILRPIATGNISVNSCAGCGQQIVFNPDGFINPCQGNLNNSKLFLNRDDKNNSMVWNTWRHRSPFNMKECINCESLSICGGGCPYSANLRGESIYSVDEVHCIFAKRVLKFAVNQLWDNIKNTEKSLVIQ